MAGEFELTFSEVGFFIFGDNKYLEGNGEWEMINSAGH